MVRHSQKTMNNETIKVFRQRFEFLKKKLMDYRLYESCHFVNVALEAFEESVMCNVFNDKS